MNELQLIPCRFCHFYNLNDREFNNNNNNNNNNNEFLYRIEKPISV